ncbi:hypothetical protein EIN_172940 [Entamoeba invadens IP1]|uniref:Uncharacterized protein n=1 Tax=Entamoeba invadens IP1 TaxID=370355 RepID=A0A0A1TVV4_ENTIV|nr:hypothetical protein EIN_172940 [Entamoeba invadens IP1]ELP84639.1 hypothetical protein EIN_172940 [Entamoeba invadens IP1]|eukprot:XP_004183985.1 hypothetical protein EIN_172940 [Entamoeba invadens IP1]
MYYIFSALWKYITSCLKSSKPETLKATQPSLNKLMHLSRVTTRTIGRLSRPYNDGGRLSICSNGKTQKEYTKPKKVLNPVNKANKRIEKRIVDGSFSIGEEVTQFKNGVQIPIQLQMMQIKRKIDEVWGLTEMKKENNFRESTRRPVSLFPTWKVD